MDDINHIKNVKIDQLERKKEAQSEVITDLNL